MELVANMMQNVAALPRESVREAITGLALTLKAQPESIPPEDFPVKHVFAPGCYAREITMPAGTVVIGKIHRHAHVNVVSAGKVRVLTEYGCEEFCAPYTFVSQPGIQRMVLILEDTVWTTVHITDKTDLAEIEREVIAESHDLIELQGSVVHTMEALA